MKYLLLILALLMPIYGIAEDQEAVVSSALASGTITRQDARNIYLLKNRSWFDGNRVVVYRMELNSIDHYAFVRSVLLMNPVQFSQEWQKLVNAGIAPLIQEVSGPRAMLSAIERKQNAVGYLGADYIVLNLGGHDAKVIRITD